MSKESYKRLLRATYSHLSRSDIPLFASKTFDEIMAMPHPQREIAFISWPRRPLERVQIAPSRNLAPISLSNKSIFRN